MSDLWNNPVVSPGFREKPPVPMNIPARVMGIVAAVRAGFGALLFLLIAGFVLTASSALPIGCGDPAVAATRQDYCATPGHTAAVVGLLLAFGGLLLEFIGGLQLLQANRRGRALVVYGIIVSLVSSLVLLAAIGGGSLLGFLIDAAMYYFVVIARFPDEQPLVTASAANPSAPGVYPPQDRINPDQVIQQAHQPVGQQPPAWPGEAPTTYTAPPRQQQPGYDHPPGPPSNPF